MATSNYGWDLPTVGGSTGTWGGMLNAIIEDLDGELHRVDELAQAAVSDTEPEFAANPTYPVEELGTVDDDEFIDVSAAPYYYVTVDSETDVLFRLTGGAAGRVAGVIVEVDSTDESEYGFAYWPDDESSTDIRWPGGEMPDHTLPGRNIWGFITRNGVTWDGVLISRNTSTGE